MSAQAPAAGAAAGVSDDMVCLVWFSVFPVRSKFVSFHRVFVRGVVAEVEISKNENENSYTCKKRACEMKPNEPLNRIRATHTKGETEEIGKRRNQLRVHPLSGLELVCGGNSHIALCTSFLAHNT